MRPILILDKRRNPLFIGSCSDMARSQTRFFPGTGCHVFRHRYEPVAISNKNSGRILLDHNYLHEIIKEFCCRNHRHLLLARLVTKESASNNKNDFLTHFRPRLHNSQLANLGRTGRAHGIDTDTVFRLVDQFLQFAGQPFHERIVNQGLKDAELNTVNGSDRKSVV